MKCNTQMRFLVTPTRPPNTPPPICTHIDIALFPGLTCHWRVQGHQWCRVGPPPDTGYQYDPLGLPTTMIGHCAPSGGIKDTVSPVEAFSASRQPVNKAIVSIRPILKHYLAPWIVRGTKLRQQWLPERWPEAVVIKKSQIHRDSAQAAKSAPVREQIYQPTTPPTKASLPRTSTGNMYSVQS